MYQIETDAGRSSHSYPTKAAANRAAEAINAARPNADPVRVVPWAPPLTPAQGILARTERLGLRVVSYTNKATPPDSEGHSYWIPRDAVANDGRAGIFHRIADADRRDVSGCTYDFDGWEPWADRPGAGTMFGGRHRSYAAALAWMESYCPERLA